MTTPPQAPRATGLRAQILVGLAVVTLLAVMSTGYLALWIAGSTVRSQREGSTLALVAAAASATSAILDRELEIGDRGNRSRLNTLLGRLTHATPAAAFQILDTNRVVVVAFPPPDAYNDIDPPIIAGALAGIPAVFNYRTRKSDGALELVAYAPITRGDRVLGAAKVIVDAPSPLATVMQTSGPILLGLVLGDAVLILFLGYLVLTRLVVRPLQDMEHATARVSAGHWDQTIDTSGPREIAALAAAFNGMTASLTSQREQLIRSEKLASVGQLAAGVAHEIGNPLAAVLGFVDLLRLDAKGGPGLAPAQRLDLLERSRAETQRIHRTIQDLLAYARTEKAADSDTQPSDLREVLRSATALLAPQARFRDIHVQLPSNETAWASVRIPADRLRQVFVNLLLNAADAMGGTGTITVDYESDGALAQLSFSDAGPGVQADLARKIFDPFFTTKDPGQGTGLGLSISRSIVESHHGSLELAAPRSSGATFVVALPTAATRPDTQAPKP